MIRLQYVSFLRTSDAEGRQHMSTTGYTTESGMHRFSVFSMQIINEKPNVIQEYENGKAIPNQQVISKLERALGVKLRGKK